MDRPARRVTPPVDGVSSSRARTVLKRTAQALAALIVLAALGAAAGGFWLHRRLAASLPRMDGDQVLAGLRAPVGVEFDALGVPTIHAADRVDLARATGFLHAQNRFFQMDLARRRAAGELAELLGPALLEADRTSRRHRCRDLAERVVRSAPEAERALLQAYSDGVNAGLAALGSAPFEYLLLRAEPAAWKPADSVLVNLAMFFVLSDAEGRRESALGVMHDLLPEPMYEFLAARGSSWDAPLVGGPIDPAPIPGPEIFDLRRSAPPVPQRRAAVLPPPDEGLPDGDIGSNNWAVSGALTMTGAALLANDMHLPISVPNTWYRASLDYGGEPLEEPGRTGAESGAVRTGRTLVTGVTLPGTPVTVVGSNGRVSWGFTNTHADWSDLVVIEVDPADPNRYQTPRGPVAFDHHLERIRVKGSADEVLDVAGTIWGPVIDKDHSGRPRALRWIAHDDRAVNSELIRMEAAGSVDEALRIAGRCGIPPQNLVVADGAGHIGWTIMGSIPRRVGFDGRLPGSWADGTRRWDGWLSPEEYPRVEDPPSGRIWTANARVVDGAMLRDLGDGGYDLGARAGQIRDDLLSLSVASEKDMLAIQLDDRALFLARWRELLLSVLTPEAIASDARRGKLRPFVESWGGRASVDSVGYRIVRAFRIFLGQQVFGSLTAACKAAEPRFDYTATVEMEAPLWQLVSARPPHMLDPRFRSWDDQLLSAVDATVDYLMADGSRLEDRTWGQRNTSRIKHPISLAVPFLGRWLDMPAHELPGDSDMPRVQAPTAGASERMVVSPGHEQQGFFHMPCGQSGHPMSPHYGDEHAAWEAGATTPFLPGPAAHRLTLKPGR